MAHRTPELRRAYSNKWYAKNRERVAAQRLAWQHANPEKRKAITRKHHLLREYDLTPEQWEAKFTAQGRACGLCGAMIPGGNGWHTDHCHDTNKLRDILCHLCNTGIGHLQHNPTLLRKAADYIERHANA